MDCCSSSNSNSTHRQPAAAVVATEITAASTVDTNFHPTMGHRLKTPQNRMEATYSQPSMSQTNNKIQHNSSSSNHTTVSYHMIRGLFSRIPWLLLVTLPGFSYLHASSTTVTSINSDVEEINTKELAQRISAELKRYSIPQAIFAQRVLCRSQGTLSDLLRNPKPWSKLKSGRETFRRMFKWLQEPEFQRMSALRMAGKRVIIYCAHNSIKKTRHRHRNDWTLSTWSFNQWMRKAKLTAPSPVVPNLWCQ